MYLEQEDDLSLIAGVVKPDGGAHGLAERLLVHPTDVPALQGHEVDGVEQPTLRLGERDRRAGSGRRHREARGIKHTGGPQGVPTLWDKGSRGVVCRHMYGIRCDQVCRLWWALCGYTYDVLADAGGHRSLADARPPPDGDAAVALRRQAQQAHHLRSTTNEKKRRVRGPWHEGGISMCPRSKAPR